MLIIGTDEAGYGPNLGPLVISATVWEARSLNELSKIQKSLESQGISIGDSKKIYHGSQSLATLECHVLSALQNSEQAAENVLNPVLVTKDVLQNKSEIFRKILNKNKICLLDLLSRSVFPEEFNFLLDQFDSKGSLLSEITLQLVFDSISKQKNIVPILVVCDKHGGRNHYLDLLMKFFPDEFIRVIQESREMSVYRFSFENKPIEFQFIAKGESQFPIALASMNSKYVRERAMLEFNSFWQEKIPGLKPTAGYPEDAKRFWENIESVRNHLNIDKDKIWRKK